MVAGISRSIIFSNRVLLMMPGTCVQPPPQSMDFAAGHGFLDWRLSFAAKPGYSTGLQSFPSGRIVWCIGMKAKANSTRRRIELGRHIVADPTICGGQPTFKGTRIMVWIVLEQLDRGLAWQEIVREWDGRVSDEAIGEAIAIADLVVKHEPFKGFNVGAGRKPSRRATALAA
jgi:uncharacterized protein (DUF433 family)